MTWMWKKFCHNNVVIVSCACLLLCLLAVVNALSSCIRSVHFLIPPPAALAGCVSQVGSIFVRVNSDTVTAADNTLCEIASAVCLLPEHIALSPLAPTLHRLSFRGTYTASLLQFMHIDTSYMQLPATDEIDPDDFRYIFSPIFRTCRSLTHLDVHAAGFAVANEHIRPCT